MRNIALHIIIKTAALLMWTGIIFWLIVLPIMFGYAIFAGVFTDWIEQPCNEQVPFHKYGKQC